MLSILKDKRFVPILFLCTTDHRYPNISKVAKP